MRKRMLVCAAALALTSGGSGFVMRAQGGPAHSSCCYANPGYAGVCAVEPAQGETCASILAYLNNPQSQGKTYCANTSVRGGWKARKCAKPTGS